MARYLFAPMPVTGHVNPGLPIAEELIRRGHDVRWYATPRFKNAIERIGARYVPFNRAFVFDEAQADEQFPDRKNYKGLAQLKYDMKTIFIDMVPNFLLDIEEELRREPADVIVGDCMAGVCSLVRERYEIPWAVYGISVFMLSSHDTAPFGLGILPSTSRIGKLRNRALQFLTDKVIFKDVNKHFAELRVSLGFSAPETTLLDFAKKADLYMQTSVPAFEYPRSDFPQTMEFIGSFVPAPPQDWTPPTWWSDLDSAKKVVLVTQGTIANEYDDLIRPAIRALADEDVLAIVTTGSSPASAVEIDPLPANVRVEQFVPYAHLMPKVDLLVTNGGYGSVQIALTHGVPLVAFGGSEDKPEIANRIQWSGVGIGVKKKRADQEKLRDAVRQVLGDQRYRLKAKAMQAELAKLDPARRAGDLLEDLAGVSDQLTSTAYCA